MELFGCFALIAIGIVVGSMGVGGSILAIPVLVYLFSIDIAVASAYSMFLIGTTSLAGVLLKLKQQLLHPATAAAFGIPSVVATFFVRRWVIPSIPETVITYDWLVMTRGDLLMLLLSILIIASSIAMILRNDPPATREKELKILPLIATGLTTGLLAGMVGVGGGFIILPALVFFAGLPFKTAVATTLLIIAANSLLGFSGDLFNRSFDWSFLLSVTSLTLLGMYIGIRSGKIIPKGITIQKSFGWLSLLAGVFILVKELLMEKL